MMSKTASCALHIRGHDPVDLVSRVKSAANFINGISPEQISGIERFGELINNYSENVTSEQFAQKFFRLFDDLFFQRSLRYCVSTKVDYRDSPIHTSCSGLAPGGRLLVISSGSSPTSKGRMLGRLLHDMIHAYLWCYGRRSFTDDYLFEHCWGFYGHGAAWQDIALVLEKFMADYCLPLSLGRNEALRLEPERFQGNLKLMAKDATGPSDSRTAKCSESISIASHQRFMSNGIPVSNTQPLHDPYPTPPVR